MENDILRVSAEYDREEKRKERGITRPEGGVGVWGGVMAAGT